MENIVNRKKIIFLVFIGLIFLITWKNSCNSRNIIKQQKRIDNKADSIHTKLNDMYTYVRSMTDSTVTAELYRTIEECDKVINHTTKNFNILKIKYKESTLENKKLILEVEKLQIFKDSVNKISNKNK